MAEVFDILIGDWILPAFSDFGWLLNDAFMMYVVGMSIVALVFVMGYFAILNKANGK